MDVLHKAVLPCLFECSVLIALGKKLSSSGGLCFERPVASTRGQQVKTGGVQDVEKSFMFVALQS